MAETDPVKAYGWTAQRRKTDELLATRTGVKDAEPIPLTSIKLPDSKLAKTVMDYAKNELPLETFNHSMRVYYYGIAIALHSFPTWLSSTFNETYFLTCLLHDIGTTPTNITATLMSFEFYGGLLVLDILGKSGSPKPQAESVSEAVIRHQDLGDTGTITTIGALVQLATIYDNVGLHPELVHKATIEEVVKAYPRHKWSSCFAATIRRENGLKPWAHTTHLGEEEFPNGVLGNKLMEPYE